MLETIAIILLVLWLLGMVSGYTMGNFIYVLLVIAMALGTIVLAEPLSPRLAVAGAVVLTGMAMVRR